MGSPPIDRLKKRFQQIAATFPASQYSGTDAHVRWYFQDAQTRTATDYLHGPAADLLTADDVTLTRAGDGRIRSIGDSRGVLGPAGRGDPGDAGAVGSHDLGAAEANPD
jgi:hypothetical protein